MKNSLKSTYIVGVGIAGMYLLMKTIAKKKAEDSSIDNDNSYIHAASGPAVSRAQTGMYEGKIKPVLDQALSFGGLLTLAPVFAVIGAVVWLDDPGPVIFTQKRIGKNKTFFYCHKFRSMKMSTPHDVPTHQLADPEQYITKVGKFLRKTSLDELPQIWDIFRGKMSVIGPRPALWNQEDLVAERDKYGANDVKPGLTGWAQINGRDELEIEEKARLDGVYAAALHLGVCNAFKTDVKCFAGTFLSVVRGDGVMEGGTGKMKKRQGAESAR